MPLSYAKQQTHLATLSTATDSQRIQHLLDAVAALIQVIELHEAEIARLKAAAK